MSKLRLAFLGFRHAHVMPLYKLATTHPAIDVVAACEPHPDTAESLRAAGTVKLTHDTYDDLYRTADFDAVAVGDYFAARDPLVIRALESGKHVIADKPICTDLGQLDRIVALTSQHKRVVGCLLDLRDNGAFRTVRRLVHEGAIGEVRTVTITAQHPLLLGKRPSWYFEPGKHGGTLNDIAIHAIDAIPWLTGRKLVEVTAARAWNARLPEHPHFQDAAQCLLRLDNDGSAFADVSYLSPDGLAYSAPQYWRLTLHGDAGLIEAAYGSKQVLLASTSDASPRQIPTDPDTPGGVLEAFLSELAARPPEPGTLTTADVFDASRKSLLIQRAADQSRCRVPL